MTTSFPSGLDAFTNPTSGDTLDSPDHAAQHADVNDAVEALQAKVGVDGSAVTSSLDYIVNSGQVNNAATADALSTARTISLTGDVTGSTSFDGSGNVSISTTAAVNLSWDVITPSSVTHGTVNADGSFDITQGIVHDIFPTTHNVFRVYATCSNRHFLNMRPYRLNGTTSSIWAGGIHFVYGGGYGGGGGDLTTPQNSSSVQVNYNDYFLDQDTPLPCTLIMDVMVDRTNNTWQATTDVRTTNNRYGTIWTCQATGHITGNITSANDWRSFEFTTVTLSNGTSSTGNVHGKVFGRQV